MESEANPANPRLNGTEVPGGDAPGTGAAAPFDFITAYADYADVLEAPRMLHEVVGIEFVAAALNGNGVRIPVGAVTLSLDLWAVLLTGSGAGRSTTIGMGAPILDAAHLAGMERSVRWGSAMAFFQEFSTNPNGLYLWGEMSERLKMLNEPKYATVKEWLTDRYDNFKLPSPFRYRDTRRKSRDTPPIVFEQVPRINILATSAEEWFFHNLVEEDSAGGFLARWLIVRVEGNRRDVAVPNIPDRLLVVPLAERLAEIARLNRTADLSAILPLYESWYVETKRRFESQPNPVLASAYFNRHRNHALKLAVIFEASRSATLKVSPEAWGRAVEFMAEVESGIFALLPTGMSARGFVLKRMEERIRAAGKGGLSQNELTRCFQSMRAKDREERIQTLARAGSILSLQQGTTGRPKVVYVHSDFRQGVA